MKALFRNMDLYRGIVLACVLLLPAAGGWTLWLRGQIEDGHQALTRATKSGGLLEEIGAMQKQVESLVKDRGNTTQLEFHQEYFERQVYSTAGGGLSQDDFTISAARERPGSSGRQRYKDYEVTISFGRRGGGDNRLALPRDYIFAMIYNAEREAPWKLRQLKIRNATDEKAIMAQNTPPPELEDKWYVINLEFARREPEKR